MQSNKKMGREIIRYGIAGMTNTLINLLAYHGFLSLGFDYKWANLIALISSKAYGYIVNKAFVFKSRCKSTKELLKEMGRFAFARGLTGLADYFGLMVSVEFFKADPVTAKYVIQAAVITVNYVMGKFIVFRHKPYPKTEAEKE